MFEKRGILMCNRMSVMFYKLCIQSDINWEIRFLDYYVISWSVQTDRWPSTSSHIAPDSYFIMLSRERNVRNAWIRHSRQTASDYHSSYSCKSLENLMLTSHWHVWYNSSRKKQTLLFWTRWVFKPKHRCNRELLCFKMSVTRAKAVEDGQEEF